MLEVEVDFSKLKKKRKKLFFCLNLELFHGEHNGRLEWFSAQSAFVRLSVSVIILSVWQKIN